jgi:hypothetical protein
MKVRRKLLKYQANINCRKLVGISKTFSKLLKVFLIWSKLTVCWYLGQKRRQSRITWKMNCWTNIWDNLAKKLDSQKEERLKYILL